METSQTHSRTVHHAYYAKKRRVVEDATTIPEAFERITPSNPMMNVEAEATSRYEDIIQQQLLETSSSSLEWDQATSRSEDIIQQQFLETSSSSLALDPFYGSQDVITERTYGRARMDYDIKAKRFPWIQEEIDYFHNYFRTIEPYLNEEQRKQKYATCLATIKGEGDQVGQYFHPHHLENSDRLKTGYLKALESYKG